MSRSLRCVHLIPYYAPAWVYGGVVRAAHGLTTALAAAGHDVTVVTTDAGQGDARWPREEMSDGVRVLRCRNLLPVLRRLNLSSPMGLQSTLAKSLVGADVLHVHELRTIENLVALPLARRMRVPVVMSPHGTLGYGAGRTAIKRGWDALFGRSLAARIDCIAALTPDEAAESRELWRQFEHTPRQIAVVPNGVHPADFADLPERADFRARWNVPPDAPLVLFLGRLHRRKGVHHLIDALAALPDVWLAVVGPDEGELAALTAQAAHRGVSERVVFTGLLTGHDKLAALSAADLLALPAVGEGLPMVVLEAMAAGLPVAISEECHLPEVVSGGAGVMLSPLDGPSVAAAVRPVLDDPTLGARMGERARTLVVDRFTWMAVAAQMAAVYASLKTGEGG